MGKVWLRWNVSVDGRPHVVELQRRSGRSVVKVDGRTIVDEKPFVDRGRWKFPITGRTVEIGLVSQLPQEWGLQVGSEAPIVGTRLMEHGAPETAQARKQRQRLPGYALLALGAVLVWIAAPRTDSQGYRSASPKLAVAGIIAGGVGLLMAAGVDFSEEAWSDPAVRARIKAGIYGITAVGVGVGLLYWWML